MKCRNGLDALTDDEQEELWSVITAVRDASPRVPDDADTWDIVSAIDKWLFTRQPPGTRSLESALRPGEKCTLHAGHELHSFQKEY